MNEKHATETGQPLEITTETSPVALAHSAFATMLPLAENMASGGCPECGHHHPKTPCAACGPGWECICVRRYTEVRPAKFAGSEPVLAAKSAAPDRWCLRCRAGLPANSRGLPYCDSCRAHLAGNTAPREACRICGKASCAWVDNSVFPHPAVESPALARERRFLTVEQLRQIIAREVGLVDPSTFWRVQPDGEFVGVVVW